MKNEELKVMGKFGIILLGILVALATYRLSAQSPQDDISGKWFAEKLDQSVIQVVRAADGTYSGVIMESSVPEYVGSRVIYDLSYDQDSETYIGKIYSVARDMELDGTFTMEADGRLKIVGSKFFMSRTFYWTRTED